MIGHLQPATIYSTAPLFLHLQDALTDVVIAPKSASTGYRGARASFGADFSGLESVLVTWRRGAVLVPDVRFLPQSSVSRGLQRAPDPDAAWDWVYVPTRSLRAVRDFAYTVGLDRGFQANLAETGYRDANGAWCLVTWGRGGPAVWSAANHAKIRAGEQQIQAQTPPSSYGAEDIELQAGGLSYRGDAWTALALAIIGATVALRGA